MRFSEWLETRLSEALNPELDRLKREEKQLLMSMEMRKDPRTGAVLGINKAGYITAAEELKKVRARIKELGDAGVSEAPKPSVVGTKTGSLPSWMQGRRAI